MVKFRFELSHTHPRLLFFLCTLLLINVLEEDNNNKTTVCVRAGAYILAM